jgi:hypothetical protein
MVEAASGNIIPASPLRKLEQPPDGFRTHDSLQMTIEK